MQNQINVGGQNTKQSGKSQINQPVQVPEKPKINYKIISAVILTCLAIFGFSGYYLRKQSSFPKTNEVQNSTTSFPTVTPINFNSNWRSYTFQPIQLTLRIPSELTVHAEEPNPGNDFAAYIQNYPYNAPVPSKNAYQLYIIWQKTPTFNQYEFQQLKNDLDISSIENTIIGGYPAIKGQIKGKRDRFVTYILKDNTIISLFTSEPTPTNKALTDQIIATFQFINSQSDTQVSPYGFVQNYPKPSSWKTVNILNHNISICLPPQWEADEWGHTVFNRDSAYKPDVLWINKFDYKGGSKGNEYINLKVLNEYEPEKLKNETKVSELSINGKSVLKIAIPSFPEALVFVLDNKLYEVQLASWNLVNDSQSAFLKDVYTVVGCIKHL